MSFAQLKARFQSLLAWRLLASKQIPDSWFQRPCQYTLPHAKDLLVIPRLSFYFFSIFFSPFSFCPFNPNLHSFLFRFLFLHQRQSSSSTPGTHDSLFLLFDFSLSSNIALSLSAPEKRIKLVKFQSLIRFRIATCIALCSIVDVNRVRILTFY